MKLLLDCGNSRNKWALAQGRQILDWGVGELDTLPSAFDDRLLESIVVASVRQDEGFNRLMAEARRRAPVHLLRTSRQQDGLCCAYQDPERLGVDRWLAMLGAWRALRQGFTLVDAGTAVTIDWVTDDGQHQGGAILPGDQFMVDSLVSATSGIRPREGDAPPEYPARDTGAAVRVGARMAVLGAVKEALVHADRAGPGGTLILAGGGADWLAEALASHQPVIRQTLVFEGMLGTEPC